MCIILPHNDFLKAIEIGKIRQGVPLVLRKEKLYITRREGDRLDSVNVHEKSNVMQTGETVPRVLEMIHIAVRGVLLEFWHAAFQVARITLLDSVAIVVYNDFECFLQD